MRALFLVAAAFAAAACTGPTTTVRCGAGTVDDGGVCTSAGGLICGSGTVLVGTQCVLSEGGPGIGCGAGTEADAGVCVPVDAGLALSCGPGTTLVDGECLPVDAGVGISCGTGTTLVGGVCVPVDAGAGITCGAGTVLVSGACVRTDDAGTGCGPGTVLDGGVCLVRWCPDQCITGRSRRAPVDGGDVSVCLGLNCACIAPYYGPTCAVLPTAIATGAAPTAGSLAPGSIVYYGFMLDAASGTATVVESSTMGAIEVYLAFQYLPYYPPSGSADFLASVIEPGNATHLAGVTSATGSGVYYLLLKNVSTSAAGFSVSYVQP